MKTFFCFISLVLLISCSESEVLFINPQPAGIESVKTIDSQLCGTYISLLDSTVLKIEPNLVTLSHFLDLKFSKNEMDSADFLKNDTLWLNKEKLNLPVKHIGDSELIYLPITDTMFFSGSTYTLKYYRNHYFINKSYHNKYYELCCIYFKPKKQVLYIKKLYKADRDLIERVTPIITSTDSVAAKCLLIDPTRRELRRLLRKNIFRISSVYKKVKPHD